MVLGNCSWYLEQETAKEPFRSSI